MLYIVFEQKTRAIIRLTMKNSLALTFGQDLVNNSSKQTDSFWGMDHHFHPQHRLCWTAGAKLDIPQELFLKRAVFLM